MPGSMISSLQILTYLIFLTSLWCRHCYSHFTGDETEAQETKQLAWSHTTGKWQNRIWTLVIWLQRLRSLATLLTVVECISQRLLQHYLLPHVHFCHVTLPTSIERWSLFLHPLESGQALWLLWPMEFRESDAVSVLSMALNCLETFTSSLLEINHHGITATTPRPPNEKPSHVERYGGHDAAWEKEMHRDRQRQRESHRETDRSRSNELPDTEWRSYLG